MANTGTPETDPLQRIVRMQLGSGRLPIMATLLTPGVLGTLLWLVAGWPLAARALPTSPTIEMLWQQALVFGLGTYFVWQYFIILLLLVHIFNSYVYLGKAPFWHFLAFTGRNALRPVRWLPLTFGRFDLTPLLVISLALFTGYHWSGWGRWLFGRVPWSTRSAATPRAGGTPLPSSSRHCGTFAEASLRVPEIHCKTDANTGIYGEISGNARSASLPAAPLRSSAE